MDQRRFDDELKSLFQLAGEDMKPAGGLYDNIQSRIKHEEEKGMNKLFSSKKIKGLVIAGAICVVSISCYAASKVYSISVSSGKEFTAPPTIVQMEKAADFSAKYVDKFANGYVFEHGGSGVVKGEDIDGVNVVSYKQLNFTYRNAEQPDAYASISAREAKAASSIESMKGEEIALGTIVGQYAESNYKFYPPNVEVSAEDLALQAEGKLEISYGSSEIQSSFFQSVAWEQDGILYELSLSNGNMSKEDLAAMAAEIIAK